MFYTAQLNAESIVSAITETPEPLTADNCIAISEFDLSLMGKRYENGVFIDKPVPAAPPIRIISRFAFRSRFMAEEKSAIYTAAESNINIRIWLDDLASAENVDLDLLETVDNVTALEAAGFIGTGRAAEILA